jgi:vitamin B12 transporter
MGNIEVTYTFEAGPALGVAVRHVGRSWDDAANSFALKPYTLVDVRASWPVSRRIELYGRVENALDEDYQTVRDYGSPGRGAYVGVRGRF